MWVQAGQEIEGDEVTLQEPGARDRGWSLDFRRNFRAETSAKNGIMSYLEIESMKLGVC